MEFSDPNLQKKQEIADKFMEFFLRHGMVKTIVNDVSKELHMSKKTIYKYFNGVLKDKCIAVWGLSFKPNTDDMREAPSIVIIQKLLEQGARIKAYDPVAIEESKKRIGNSIEYASDRYEAVIDADALILITEWAEFRVPNFIVMKKLMKQKVVFDGRNIYDPEEMKEHGFTYFGIGRKNN